MTRLRLAPGSWSNLDRITQHFHAHEVDDVEARMAELLDALQLLALHPLISLPVSGGLRELMSGAAHAAMSHSISMTRLATMSLSTRCGGSGRRGSAGGEADCPTG